MNMAIKSLQPESQSEYSLQVSQPWSQSRPRELPSHESSQLSPLLHATKSLRARRPGVTRLYRQERTGGRADRPAAVTIRSDAEPWMPSQLPPSACAVDSARDRVRREGRGLVVRWEHPAMDCGERDREVDEHRISRSVHRPASGGAIIYGAGQEHARHARAAAGTACGANSSRRGVWCRVAMAGRRPWYVREVAFVESYSADTRARGRAVRGQLRRRRAEAEIRAQRCHEMRSGAA